LVNDRYGHAAGDLVLRAVADAARGVGRATDAVARYGGEEFVLVAPETDLDSATQLAERLRERLDATEVACDGHMVRITASFGVAVLHADDRAPDDLFRRGDRALYAAKDAGRNRVVVEGAV
jgi:diguanylate cyclase (GGDEF)-like protein